MELQHAIIGLYLLNRILKAIGVQRGNSLMITWICAVFALSWDLLQMFQVESYDRIFIFNIFHLILAIWIIWTSINRGKLSAKQLLQKEEATKLAREQVLYWKEELKLEKAEALNIYYKNKFKLNDEYMKADYGIVLKLIQEEYGDAELEEFWLKKYIV